VASFLTDVSKAGYISSVLPNKNNPDLNINALAQKLEPYAAPGSVSQSDRNALFNAIAQGGATSDQLVGLSNALALPNDIAALGSAVANYSLPETQLGYINGMSPQTTSQTPKGYAAAIAVGSVLAGLKGHPQEVNQAFNSLISGGQLSAVIQAAERDAGGPAPFTAVNNTTGSPALLDGIINSAATGTDNAMKAQVFEQADQALTEIKGEHESEGSGQVVNSLTNLLETNPQAIVSQLELTDHNGHALTDYASGELAQGQSGTQVLGNLLNQLRFGPRRLIPIIQTPISTQPETHQVCNIIPMPRIWVILLAPLSGLVRMT